MSHYTVLVIGPNHEAQLAPFQENNMGDCPKGFLRFRAGDDWFDTKAEATAKVGAAVVDEEGRWENPNRRWDWWTIGGRWSGLLKLKNGKPADQAKKADIDLKAMRHGARTLAGTRYDRAMSFLAHLPPNKPWTEIRDTAGMTPDSARAAYWAQPRCEAWRTAEKAHDWPFHPFYDSPDEFLASRERLLELAANKAGVTHAVLKDGQWFEQGKMGWWAHVRDAKDPETWASMFHKLLDDLPDDALLTVVDCHI